MKKIISAMLVLVMMLSMLASCARPMQKGILEQSAIANTQPLSETLGKSAGLGDVRVMSFNLQVTLANSAFSDNKTNRQRAVVAEILSYMPDLIGLQEDSFTTWNGYLSENLIISEGVKYLPIIDPNVGIASEGVIPEAESYAIYYNPTTLELVDYGYCRLATSTEDGGNGKTALKWSDVTQEIRDALNMTTESRMYSSYYVPYDSDGDGVKESTEKDVILDQRRMTYGIFKTANGDCFLHVNTHLQHRSQTGNIATHIPEFLQLREMERMAEWDILQAKIKSIRTGDYANIPVIITGDLNETLASPSYHYFLGTGEYTENTPYVNSAKEALIRRDQDGTMNNGFSLDDRDTNDKDEDGNKDEWYSLTNGVIHETILKGDKSCGGTLDYCLLTPGAFTVEQYQVGDGRAYLSGTTHTSKLVINYVKALTDEEGNYVDEAGEPLDAKYVDKDGNLLDENGKKTEKSREIVITQSEKIEGYVYTSDHLPIIVDLTIGVEEESGAETKPMALQKPGSETSPVSYYKDKYYYDDQGNTVTATTAPAGKTLYGGGTPDISWYDPNNKKSEYVLTRAAQLMGFMELRYEMSGKSQVLENDFEGVTIKLGANMVINKGTAEEIAAMTSGRKKWTVLASTLYFKGVFDGDGHYVSGVYIESGGSGIKGMFGGVSGNAVIKNFSLLNSHMVTATVTTKHSFGSIVSRINEEGANVSIYNVYSDAIIVEHNDVSFKYCGGIVGNITGSVSVSLDHCTYAGSITVQGERVGGLIGNLDSGAQVTITDCVTSGNIVGGQYTGGMIGYGGNSGTSITMESCVNISSVTGTTNVGGLIGSTSHSGFVLSVTNSANKGKVIGGNYTGGLMGYVRAGSAIIQNCANLGDVTAMRMSGGLIGTLNNVKDLVIYGCVVNADLDFSGIATLDEDTVNPGAQVANGCQVGGLVGRTWRVGYDTEYDTEVAYISNCALYGTLKATDHIVTSLDTCTKTSDEINYVDEFNHLAAGGIFGFNSRYDYDAEGKAVESICRIHVDHIVVSMEMEGVDAYLGGTRNIAINQQEKNNWRISYKYIMYDSEKIGDLPVWGMRVDKDRHLDHVNEKNSQISGIQAFTGYNFVDNTMDLTVTDKNYTDWYTAFTLWSEMNLSQIVPNAKVKGVIEKAQSLSDFQVVTYQTKETEGKTATHTDYRFVAAVRDTSYMAYAFAVTISYMNGTERVVRNEVAYCPVIYKSLTGGNKTYQASEYDAEYLAALVIKGVPNNARNVVVEIEPITADMVSGDVVTYENNIASVFVINPSTADVAA